MGYLLFKGKNNNKESAGLVGGSLPYGLGLKAGTKEEAQKFFTTQEAKEIILSVRY